MVAFICLVGIVVSIVAGLIWFLSNPQLSTVE
jgi:hypothetical protein